MGTSTKTTNTKAGAVDIERLVAALDEAVSKLSGASLPSSPGKVRRARIRLEAAARSLSVAAEKLDSTRRPASIFDPSNPALIGRFIALTMIAQDRVALASINRFYGAGVYAIYYAGSFKRYAPITKTEHPIYVGKADPDTDTATTAVEQGTKLWDRLNEHRKNIAKAKNLDITHFECRFLVVASGWQKAAEDYLISLFRPIWNSEVGLVFGIGKHGDAFATRGNKRSPWDTLHPGRTWAANTTADQKSVSKIDEELAKHFAESRPYKNLQDIFSRFMAEMHQLPTIAGSDDASDS